MSRRGAREIALHILYEMTYDAADAEEVLSEHLSPEGRARLAGEIPVYAKPLEERDEAFIRAVVTGVSEHRDELDARIAECAVNWRVERIGRIALAVLRMAAFEILFHSENDDAVAANEAVKLTKEYDTQESASFVNGVIGALIRGKEAK